MKLFSLFSFLMGQNLIVCDEKDAVKILNICMKNRIVYRDPQVTEDGSFSLWCTPFMSYVLFRECEKHGVTVKICKKIGLPSLIDRYKNRIGLIIGVLCAFFIILVSDDYVWDIRIDGNESVTYTELINVLSECGIEVGSKISELDVDAIETKTMLACKKISWMTINIQGTYANIQIRETGERTDDNKETRPSNLVAIRDGQIERVELFSGNAMVRHGDVVRRGDILVSGVWDSNHFGLFVTRSSGKVFARTERVFCVEIPFEYEKKVLVNRKIREKYLIFFSKEIKVFENAGNMGASCDTIERVENLRLFNGDRLPVGVRTVSELFYEKRICRYTEDEAMRIAYIKLGEIMDAELSGAELLSKSFDYEITDEEYILYCRVKCIEDIAEMKEFDFTPGG